jgi:hypothetical protein
VTENLVRDIGFVEKVKIAGINGDIVAFEKVSAD